MKTLMRCTERFSACPEAPLLLLAPPFRFKALPFFGLPPPPPAVEAEEELVESLEPQNTCAARQNTSVSKVPCRSESEVLI